MSENTIDHPSLLENLSRLTARGLVVAGGLFWVIAAFSGPYVYQGMSLTDSLTTAMWPFFTAIVILITGWTYERLAAVLLGGASAAVVVWGVLFQWEIGVWVLMSFVLIAPMMLAGILFLVSSNAEAHRLMPAATRKPIAVRAFATARHDRVQTRPH